MMSNTETLLGERRAALNAVLESKEFSRAPALAKLLKYLCEKTFEGRMHEIKEFSIATDVYARAESFGERRDSVVRVEVSRLRKRLANYYADEGASHRLHIVIPAGTYQPRFESLPPPVADPVAIPPAPPKRWRSQILAGAVVGAIVITVALLITFSRGPKSRTATPSPAQTSLTPNPSAAAGVPHPVRILAGSSTERSVDRFGAEQTKTLTVPPNDGSGLHNGHGVLPTAPDRAQPTSHKTVGGSQLGALDRALQYANLTAPSENLKL